MCCRQVPDGSITIPALDAPICRLPPSLCPLLPWLLKSFFEDTPPDMEAPRNGKRCSMAVCVLQIAARPALLDARPLAFIFFWNEFFFAVILTRPR
jgi:ABC-type glycerol-3-phosphate transport system permease component